MYKSITVLSALRNAYKLNKYAFTEINVWKGVSTCKGSTEIWEHKLTSFVALPIDNSILFCLFNWSKLLPLSFPSPQHTTFAYYRNITNALALMISRPCRISHFLGKPIHPHRHSAASGMQPIRCITRKSTANTWKTSQHVLANA